LPTTNQPAQIHTLKTLQQVEADYLRNISLQYHQGLDKLATELGISKRTLYRKLQQFNISIKNKT
jgi:transcriptional regulator with PAS, ATPase and Fis domain